LIPAPSLQFQQKWYLQPFWDLRLRVVVKVIVFAGLIFSGIAGFSAAPELSVYFGAFTQTGQSKGIGFAAFNSSTGELSEPVLAAKVFNPNFILCHPNGKFVYAVSEEHGGTVKAFAVSQDGKTLTQLNEQPSGGEYPCHLTIDRAGKNLFVANYSGGSVAMLPINADGSVVAATSVMKHHAVQTSPPRPHNVHLSPDERFLFVTDLGLDMIKVYRVELDSASLTPYNSADVALKQKSGPRHFTFHPNGKSAYVIAEHDSTITRFDYNDQTGKLSPVQTVSTLPPEYNGKNWCAEIKVRPDGKFLYGSNRGHNSIAIFRIDQTTGALTAAGHQGAGISTPRHFNIDDSGQYCLVANQTGNNVSLYKIDNQSGQLMETARQINISAPVCVQFKPAVIY
jgi:6-phosphogluconolactonase